MPAWIRPLSLFVLIYVLSYIDRQLLSLVVRPLKASLDLSDVQIGFLQGFGFSIVLAVSALFTARLVDTGNRTRLLALAIIAWCTMTIFCGFADSFTTLLVARAGLAIAEAIVPMAVLSILSDVTTRASLPRASALFMIGPYLGSGLALLFGGQLLSALAPFEGRVLPVLGVFEPWRGLFILIGAPGIVLGTAILFLMREPARPIRSGASASSVSVWPFLRGNARILFMMTSLYAFLNAVSLSIYAWTPTYFVRVHGLETATVGLLIGPIIAICGIGGCILGTYMMSGASPDRALCHVLRQSMRLATVGTVPLLLMPLAPTVTTAIILLALGVMLSAAVMSSTLTPIQLFAPAELRGRATAVSNLYVSGMGGMGPLAIGALADWAFPWPTGVGYAMAVTYAAALVVVWIVGPVAVRLTAEADRRRDEGETLSPRG